MANNEYINDYIKQHYYQVLLTLKYSEDFEIIEWLNEQKEWGYTYNEIMHTALREYYEEERKGNHG